MSLRHRCVETRFTRSFVVAALIALPAVAAAQSRERVLYVSALDKDGAPVTALTPKDVLVREDGVSREVLRVVPATDPIQVAVLVDNSAAADPDISNFRRALATFVKTMSPGNEISLITYADRPTIVTNTSTSNEDLQQGVNRIFSQPTAGAYVLEAIEETAQGFIKRQSPRPVMIIVDTEGREFSNSTYQPVLDKLFESGAQLYVMALTRGGDDLSRAGRDRGIVFDRGTRETGGRREILLTSMGLEPALEKLAAELKSQYKVTYSRPESLIPPKDIKVASARPELDVRGIPARQAGK